MCMARCGRDAKSSYAAKRELGVGRDPCVDLGRVSSPERGFVWVLINDVVRGGGQKFGRLVAFQQCAHRGGGTMLKKGGSQAAPPAEPVYPSSK